MEQWFDMSITPTPIIAPTPVSVPTPTTSTYVNTHMNEGESNVVVIDCPQGNDVVDLTSESDLSNNSPMLAVVRTYPLLEALLPNHTFPLTYEYTSIVFNSFSTLIPIDFNRTKEEREGSMDFWQGMVLVIY